MWGPKLMLKRRRNGDIVRAMLRLEEDFSYDKSQAKSKECKAKKLRSKN